MKPHIPTPIRYILTALIVEAIILVGAICAKAQTNLTPPQTFFQSTMNYFSSFNTNLADTFASDSVDVWAGADTVNNQTMAASFGIEYLPFHATSTNAFASGLSLESVTRNSTVAGTVVSEQGGIGFGLTHIDTRLTGYIDFGHRFDTDQSYFAPGLRVKKALTDNTFAGVGLELPIYLSSGHGLTSGAPAPTLSVFSGFRF